MAVIWSTIGTQTVARPKTVLACVCGITLLAIVGLTRLRFDDRPNNSFRGTDAGYQRLQVYQEIFGSDDNDILVLISVADRADGDLFTPNRLTTLRSLADRMAEVEGVRSVWGLPNLPNPDAGPLAILTGSASGSLLGGELTKERIERLRDQIANDPIASQHLIGGNGTATLLVVHADNERDAIKTLEPVVKGLREVAAAVTEGSGLRVQLTGIPPLRIAVFNAIRRENTKFLIIGAALSLGCAWLLFRRFRLVLLVGGGPLIGTIWTMGGMGLAGVKVDVISVIVPTLVIVIGLTNAIHLMTDLRRSLEAGRDASDAAASAVAHLGGSCFLAAITTGIGFVSLAVSDIESIARFGLVCGAGSLLAFLADVTLVPVLGSLWLSPDQFVSSTNEPQRKTLGRWDRPLTVLGRFVDRFPKAISIGGGLLLISLATTVPDLRPDSWLKEATPPEWEIHRSIVAADRDFGGAIMGSVAVNWDSSLDLGSPETIAAIREVERMVADEEMIGPPLSVLDPLRSFAPDRPVGETAKLLSAIPSAREDESLRRLVNFEERSTQVTFRLTDRGAYAYEPIFSRLESRIDELNAQHPGLRIELTGTVVVIARSINTMIRDLASSLAVAGVTIFLVITITFRSLRWGLLSLIPNSLPLLTAAAFLVLTDRPLQLSSIMVFSICLGIAVDDTIHYLNRHRRERIDRREKPSESDTDSLTVRTLRGVGPALINSTLVLLAGFGSVLLSEMPPSRNFAILSCTAIAVALFGDILILAALLRWADGNRTEPNDSANDSAAGVSP